MNGKNFRKVIEKLFYLYVDSQQSVCTSVPIFSASMQPLIILLDQGIKKNSCFFARTFPFKCRFPMRILLRDSSTKVSANFLFFYLFYPLLFSSPRFSFLYVFLFVCLVYRNVRLKNKKKNA